MKLAVLSDIHGNAEALRVTLREARSKKAEHLLVLGDLVGYYYDATDVVRQLCEWPKTVIAGNHERMLAAARNNKQTAISVRATYGSAIDVALETLSREDIDWIVGLPSTQTIEMGGHIFELYHGSPNDPDEYVYPDATRQVIEKCRRPGKIVLMGHTHYPMIAAGDGLLINPGSVGQARDIGGFSSWAMFDTTTEVVTLHRTSYDVTKLIEEVSRRDPALPYLKDVLVRNRLAASAEPGLKHDL
jgi:putative phosphoesterase